MRVTTSRKAGVLAVMLSVGLAVGLLSNSGGPSSSEAGARASVALSQAQERYGLLRRERSEADAMLAAPNSSVGQDPAQARRARTTDAGWRIWAVPNNDGICVEGLPPSMSAPDIGPGGVCGGAETIAEGVVATMGAGPKGNEFFKGGETVLFGLVPDGVKNVELRLADGGSQTLPVEDNAFHADVIGQTAGVRYTDASGRSHDLAGASWDGVDGDA